MQKPRANLARILATSQNNVVGEEQLIYALVGLLSPLYNANPGMQR